MTDETKESYITDSLTGEELVAHEEKVFSELRGNPFIAISILANERIFTGASQIGDITAINLLLTAIGKIVNRPIEEALKVQEGETIQ